MHGSLAMTAKLRRSLNEAYKHPLVRNCGLILLDLAIFGSHQRSPISSGTITCCSSHQKVPHCGNILYQGAVPITR
jgi:hypothetical protein